MIAAAPEIQSERHQLEERIRTQERELEAARAELERAEQKLRGAVEAGAPDAKLEPLQTTRDKARHRAERAELRLASLTGSARQALEKQGAERELEVLRQRLEEASETAESVYSELDRSLLAVQAACEPLSQQQIQATYHARQRARELAKEHRLDVQLPRPRPSSDELLARVGQTLRTVEVALRYTKQCW